MLDRYARSTNLDLQQRAVELKKILQTEASASILDAMPAPEDQGNVTIIPDAQVTKTKQTMKPPQPTGDLLGDLLGDAIPTTAMATPAAAAQPSVDLLSELMGSSNMSTHPVNAGNSSAGLDLLGDMLSNGGLQQTGNTPSTAEQVSNLVFVVIS